MRPKATIHEMILPDLAPDGAKLQIAHTMTQNIFNHKASHPLLNSLIMIIFGK